MTRAEIEALLPFLANGTLEGRERAEVEEALASDADLLADFEALVAIRSAMRQDDRGYSPGEMGLARLMRAVADESPAAAPPVPAADERRRLDPRIWRIAASVLLAIALAQAALLLGDRGGSSYELAGEEAAALVATVRPETTEADLRAALLDAGVEIVGGPSALGIYRLAPLDEEISADRARASLLESGLFETVDAPRN